MEGLTLVVWSILCLTLPSQVSLQGVCPKGNCITADINYVVTYSCVEAGCTAFPGVEDNLDVDVQVIDLSQNEITSIPVIQTVKVEELNLAFNRISQSELEPFKYCTLLKSLNLTGNNIGPDMMNGNVFALWNTALWELFLDHNQITILNGTEVFDGADWSLEHLDLSYNNMEYLSPEALRNLDALKDLKLSYNKLSKLAPRQFQGLWQLEYLHLDHNEITGLQSGVFDNCRAVTVDLRHNKIKEIASDAFMTFSDIEILFLNYNDLPKVKEQQFINLTELQSIYIEHTNLETIEPGAFPSNLKKISIQYTNLKEIVNGTFSGLPFLKQVAIQDNDQLHHIQSGAFDLTDSNVETILLKGNRLWSLSDQLLNWQQVTTVELLSNQWDCDCHIYWMKEQLQPRTIEDLECATPMSYSGRKIKDLSQDDFTCNFFKKHKYEGAVALGIMVSLLFATGFIMVAYRYRTKVLPCWFGKKHNYDALYEEDNGSDEDDDEVTATFHNSSTVSNEKVGFRLANGSSPAPTPV